MSVKLTKRQMACLASAANRVGEVFAPVTPSEWSTDGNCSAACEREAARGFAPRTDIAGAYAAPRFIQLEENLFIAQFEIMKLLPAKFMLDDAFHRGLLGPGGTVIESTSGTLGLALAMVCKNLGLHLILVTGEANLDPGLRVRLEGLGARIEVVSLEEGKAAGGMQVARLSRVEELRRMYPGAFFVAQYRNPSNLLAYQSFAALINQAIPKLAWLVGPCGTGGSACGTASSLRAKNPRLKVCGTDEPRSVLFGHAEGTRLIGGMSNSIMPPVFDHTVFDEVQWTPASVAFYGARELQARYGLFVGGSSGAAYVAARNIAKRNRKENVLFISPDSGHRYVDTFFNPSWLKERQLDITHIPDGPRWIQHPCEGIGEWTAIRWNRRTYSSVVGHEYNGR